jgi:quinol monooxygenase YgiN
MVVEQVELNPIEGNEDELLAYVAANRGVLEHSKGCRHFMFGRGVEDPSKVFFVVTWDSLEAHKAATQTPEFAQFSGALRGFVTGAKAGHFEIVERR